MVVVVFIVEVLGWSRDRFIFCVGGVSRLLLVGGLWLVGVIVFSVRVGMFLRIEYSFFLKEFIV